jgi:hypothetical protein
MNTKHFHFLALVPIVAIACGGSNKTSTATGDDDSTPDGGTVDGSASDSATTGDDSSTATGGNVAQVIVNGGPPNTGATDVPYISVTLCIPGTTTCQTIPYISVDTGSSGFRVISSVLSGLALPQQSATTGDPLVECMTFDDGYTWGSVRTADLKIGGEVAANIPIQVIGDPTFTAVPSACSSSGPAEDTVSDFGGNGIIGINQLIPDCGDYCSNAADVGTGAYYSCSGSTCTAVAVADADQVSNPIASFASDNNGAVLTFPTISDHGAATLTGSLTFGIGTQSNNGLGSATVQTVDEYANLTTIYNGVTMDESYIDSGTNLLSFNDTSIAQCTGELAGYYCPTTEAMLTAQNKGLNGATTTVSFSIESAQTLFGSGSNTAFDDIGGTGDNGSFAWGFPFFIGRSVFIGLDGATTPGGAGPFVAY